MDENHLIYKFYNLMKTVYLFPHTKPYISDTEHEFQESFFIMTIGTVILCSFFFVVFKFLLVFIYFFMIQVIMNIIDFFFPCQQFKYKPGLFQTIKQCINYLIKVICKLYTYTFYIFPNIIFGFIFILIFLGSLICNLIYFSLLKNQIEKERKTDLLYYMFFITFELEILTELFCISFYNIRNMNYQSVYLILYFISINAVIYFGISFESLLINKYGSFTYEEPNRVMNIIMNTIFGANNVITFIKLYRYNNNGKIKFNFSFRSKFCCLIKT